MTIDPTATPRMDAEAPDVAGYADTLMLYSMLMNAYRTVLQTQGEALSQIARKG